MSLESTFFKKDYHYRVQFVNHCLRIMKLSCEKRRLAYRNLVFKMMKDIVKKNISNYLNLLNSINVKPLPSRDELIIECYLIFDKCVDKYILADGHNFYYYFNKSLSRNFFRSFQKEMRHNNNSVKITDSLVTINSNFHDNSQLDTTELLMILLNLSDIEMKICRSRLSGQKVSEFLEENNISSLQYSRLLKNIKEILINSDIIDHGE